MTLWPVKTSNKIVYNFSRLMTKPRKWPMCPAKTQISLGIRGCPGWSESSLGAHAIVLVLSCCDSFSGFPSVSIPSFSAYQQNEASFNETRSSRWSLWLGYVVMFAIYFLFSFVSSLTVLSHGMRKPVLAICEKQRCRSACASAQSDQHLCFCYLDSIISLVSTSKISRF